MIRWVFTFSKEGSVETFVNTQEEDQAIANAVDSHDEFVYLKVPGKMAYVRLSEVKMVLREEIDEKELERRAQEAAAKAAEAAPAVS
jgi:intergrase/recombinase